MQKVKLTRVFTTDTKKDTGEKFRDKNGKPFWRVGIQTDKTGDDWYSTITYDAKSREMQLSEGQEVELVFEEKNGFKNFKLPSKLDLLEIRVTELEKKLGMADMELTPDEQMDNLTEGETDKSGYKLYIADDTVDDSGYDPVDVPF
jgi:hypothetical protein